MEAGPRHARVGLLVGREWSFPPAIMDEVHRRDQNVSVEYVKLGGTAMTQPVPWAVIVDRISHEVPYYRSFLKHAVVRGVTVINNPFMQSAGDRFFGASLARKLGIAHPKTVALPNKDYVPGIVHSESLRNLIYPLDWKGIVDHVGLPCMLRDAQSGGGIPATVCESLGELIDRYDRSGLRTMIVQERIDWDQYVHCICIGRSEVMPIRYDPEQRQHLVDSDHLAPALRERVVANSLQLVRALGYDMTSIEWAIRDGVPFAINFMNPAPDLDVHTIGPQCFEWVVDRFSELVVHMARRVAGQNEPPGEAGLFGVAAPTG